MRAARPAHFNLVARYVKFQVFGRGAIETFFLGPYEAQGGTCLWKFSDSLSETSLRSKQPKKVAASPLKMESTACLETMKPNINLYDATT